MLGGLVITTTTASDSTGDDGGYGADGGPWAVPGAAGGVGGSATGVSRSAVTIITIALSLVVRSETTARAWATPAAPVILVNAIGGGTRTKGATGNNT